jgi:asparagine synthase (glutamine-hydrolysing)
VCGILGVLARDSAPPPLDAVELLRHRGPDGEGRRAWERCAFAMRRLAIIDLDTGDQPVENETGDVVALCNGEIYNYRELRAELTARGHTFRAEVDVEVIPHLYEELGERCFERLRGMFAIALWDARNDRLVLARDRFGIKPLYLADTPSGFAFASEIAPLLALGASDELDPQAVSDYLALGYVPGSATGLRDVRKLAPGHAWVDGDERPYWELTPHDGLLEDTLREAVRLHLRSDVPLAVLLSGGLDSSLIASLAAAELDEPLRTFSVGFADTELDERGHARVVADAIGSVHRELVVETDVAEDLPAIAARLEQPVADVAAIPLWYLCRAVADEVKVALAGDGGDEVFGGYSRYAWDPRAARIGRLVPRALLERVPTVDGGRKALARRTSKLLRHAGKDPAARYLAWFAVLSDDVRAALVGSAAQPPEREFRRLLDAAPRSLTPLGRLQYVDLYSFVADNLMLKADKLSMAHSLELRVPFLDHRVVELGLALPDREKVRGVTTKVALRKLVEQRFGRTLARRPKQGFDAPIERWLDTDLRELAGDAVGELGDVVDVRAARGLRGEPLYALVMLALWRAGLRRSVWTPVR